MTPALAPIPVVHVEVDVAGDAWRLMPQKAAAWGETLLVADLHLGKSESLQVLGVSAPTAVLDETLARLDAARAQAGAARVIVLGDLLHAPSGLTPGMIERVAAWREAFAAEVVVVPGNHDRRLASLAGAWRLTIAPERLDLGPFAFTHDPRPVPGRHVVGGHLHPCVRVPNGRFPLKLACFHLRPGVAVLPAFTAFAAGVPVRRGAGDRVFAIAEGRVCEV